MPSCSNHWFLMVICNPGLVDVSKDERIIRGEPYLLVMDSLGGHHSAAFTAIRSYLKYEYLARRGKPVRFGKEQMGEKEVSVPEQDNDADCGIYLLHYVQLIFKVSQSLCHS